MKHLIIGGLLGAFIVLAAIGAFAGFIVYEARNLPAHYSTPPEESN